MRSKSRLSLALVACLASASAVAGEAEIRQAVSAINSKATIKSITPNFPIPGMNEVVADASVVYISDDGRYVFYGSLLDFKEKKNLSEVALSKERVALLSKIPSSWKISYEPKEVKARVTVFTDISCGYCQRLHADLPQYLARGIAIDYVPFPRGGAQSEVAGAMNKIWCAKNRTAAYDNAVQNKPIGESTNCESPILASYALGDKLNVEGTPAIFDANGRQVGGYLPPDGMAKALGITDLGGADTSGTSAK